MNRVYIEADISGTTDVSVDEIRVNWEQMVKEFIKTHNLTPKKDLQNCIAVGNWF
jgi:hypothetical protein